MPGLTHPANAYDAGSFTAYDVEGFAVAVRESGSVVIDGAWADFEGSWVEVAFAAVDGGTYLLIAPAWVFADAGPLATSDPMRCRVVSVGAGEHVGLLLSAGPVR